MSPAHPHFPLRGGMVVRYRGGDWPPSTGPWPIRVSRAAVGWLSATAGGLAPEHWPLAHPGIPRRSWMVVRYRGGIREPNVIVNEN